MHFSLLTSLLEIQKYLNERINKKVNVNQWRQVIDCVIAVLGRMITVIRGSDLSPQSEL